MVLARTNFNPRNASYGTEQKYHSKLFKHSKCDVIFTSQNKAKNVLELPKSTVEIFNALEKLNAEKTINQSLELSSTSKVESSPDKRICDKMESNENKPAIIFESNNTEDRDLHSLKTKNPKEKLNLDQSSQKGKTEGFDNENLMHRNKTGKHILRKGYSEGGIMNSFEEFGSSDPIHEVNSSTLIITNIPTTVREWINHLPSNNSRYALIICK